MFLNFVCRFPAPVTPPSVRCPIHRNLRGFRRKNRAHFRRASHRMITKITLIDAGRRRGPSVDRVHVWQSLRVRGALIFCQNRCEIARFAPKNSEKNPRKSAQKLAERTQHVRHKRQHAAGMFSASLRQRRCLCADLASLARALRSKFLHEFIEICAVFVGKNARIFGAHRTVRSPKSFSSMQGVGVDLQSTVCMF